MIHNNLAVVLAASGDLNQAFDQCQQALALKPNYPEALANLGMLLEKTGDASAAIKPLEQSLALQPDVAKAQYTLAIALIELNRPPEALPHAEAAWAS